MPSLPNVYARIISTLGVLSSVYCVFLALSPTPCVWRLSFIAVHTTRVLKVCVSLCGVFRSVEEVREKELHEDMV